VTKDLTRVMNRTKALYRSWAIPCAGEKVYSPRLCWRKGVFTAPPQQLAGTTVRGGCASTR
jgi:hypothetical protein